MGYTPISYYVCGPLKASLRPGFYSNVRKMYSISLVSYSGILKQHVMTIIFTINELFSSTNGNYFQAKESTVQQLHSNSYTAFNILDDRADRRTSCEHYTRKSCLENNRFLVKHTNEKYKKNS